MKCLIHNHVRKITDQFYQKNSWTGCFLFVLLYFLLFNVQTETSKKNSQLIILPQIVELKMNLKLIRKTLLWKTLLSTEKVVLS